MIIGIIRHFRVKHRPKAKWMNFDQFYKWVEAYDNSEIILPNEMSRIGDWDICFSSDLKRSELTANSIYAGTVVRTNDLREISTIRFRNTKIKLHYNIWLIINRIVWYFLPTAQEETKHGAILRAKKFIESIEKSDYSKILIVSHGVFMKCLDKELKRRGYKGKMGLIPKNGRLIIYNK